MKTLLLTFVLLLTLTQAAQANVKTFRDFSGKVVYRASVTGNRTVYTDKGGKTIGWSIKAATNIRYFDAKGRLIGTERCK